MKKKLLAMVLALVMCLSVAFVPGLDSKAATATWKTSYVSKMYGGTGTFDQMYFGLNDFNEDGVPEMILSFYGYMSGATTADPVKLAGLSGVFTFKNGATAKVSDYCGEFVFRNGSNYVFASRVGSDKAWFIQVVKFTKLDAKLITQLSYDAVSGVASCTQDGEPIPSSDITEILGKYGVKFEVVASGNDAGKASISATKATSLITYKLFSDEEGSVSDKKSKVVNYINSYKVRMKTGMIMTIQDQTYNGNYITPLVAVTAGGAVLKKDKDFTVEYADNKEVGTATVTVTGKGDYIGTAKKTFKIVKDTTSKVDIGYATYVQSFGWTPIVKDGTVSGTLGLSKRIEAIQIKLTKQDYEGSVVYSSYVQGAGWQGWKSNLAVSGTLGKSKRLEGLKVKLTKKMAEHYDVYYRTYAQSYGWLGWAKNGAASGTALGKRIEAVSVKLVKKGGSAPGTTAKAYVSK